MSCSRAKERTRVYTDDKQPLVYHASELGEHQSAIQLIRKNKKMHMDFVVQQQRAEQTQEKPKELNPITKEKEEYESER